jgi:spermidine synthase
VSVQHGRRGRTLRIDGTFASWYAPGTPITGSVWDALAAPVLMLPPQRRRRVLILGLGGGSAARIVRAIAPRARITGVEWDSDVVRAARRWFDLDRLGVEVVQGDARHHLERTRRSYDVILEDIFVGRGRGAHKPDWLPNPGIELAARRLTPGGVLASNAIDEAPEVACEMRRWFRSTLHIDVDGYDNRVVVGSGFPLSGRTLRSAVVQSPVLGPSAERLRFRSAR